MFNDTAVAISKAYVISATTRLAPYTDPILPRYFMMCEYMDIEKEVAVLKAATPVPMGEMLSSHIFIYH
ncbi:MAG: hypothetical protein WBM37_14590 [Nitrososphaeraceae archaeon]|jgi:hypothetical protein